MGMIPRGSSKFELYFEKLKVNLYNTTNPLIWMFWFKWPVIMHIFCLIIIDYSIRPAGNLTQFFKKFKILIQWNRIGFFFRKIKCLLIRILYKDHKFALNSYLGIRALIIALRTFLCIFRKLWSYNVQLNKLYSTSSNVQNFSLKWK